MSLSQNAIEVIDATKSYGSLRATENLSFSVNKGEVFGILGPNGAGKTTTVEMLEGYRFPDSGQVRVLGLDPKKDAATLHERVGVMLQEGGLSPGLKVAEALRLYRGLYSSPDDPERLLRLVELQDSSRTLIRRLSGGQRQRLSLALALIGRPEVIFLDEPTAGMDPRARLVTWEIIRQLRTDGVTVLLTTHGMDEAESLCDRVAILDRGALVAIGSPRDLTTRSDAQETRFTAQSELDLVSLAIALGIERVSLTEYQPGQYSIAAEPTPDLIARLAIWLREQNVRLGTLEAGQRSLEEVFLRLTGEGEDR